MATTTVNAFSPTEALRFGWEKTTANLRVLMPIGAAGAFFAALQSGLTRSGGPGGGGLAALGVQLLQVAVTLAFLRTALKLHDGHPVGEWNLSELLAGFWPFLFTNLLYGLVVAGGLILLVVPGVLWAIQYGFAPLLVADHKLDPIAALDESKRLTAGNKGQLLKFGLLMLATNLVGALALGIGLLVTIPTTTIAAAHVFRQLQAQAPGRTTSITSSPLAHGGA